MPLGEREISSQAWIKKFMQALSAQKIAGLRVRPRVAGIRGLRTGSSDDDVSVRVQGPDLHTLERLGEQIAGVLRETPGLRNVRNSAEEIWHELAVQIDRQRATELGVEVADVGQALRVALDGIVVSDFLDGDRSYDIRVRLPEQEFDNPAALGGVLLFGERRGHPAVYLRDVARVDLVAMPAEIHRENQRRIVDVTASLTDEFALGEVMAEIRKQLDGVQLPPGYTLYTGGLDVTLERGRRLAWVLVGLALFLVYVVMAVQYESLRNPTVIMLSVPFALIGVSLGLKVTGLALSMPVWMGIIMLVGIVVNNAIVLVEYIEIMRERGLALHAAIVEAGRLRLRPILMTTITTVVGMSPLALALGEGAEMLQPLAVTIVAGLSFSMFVSLLLVPAVYLLFCQRTVAAMAQARAS